MSKTVLVDDYFYTDDPIIEFELEPFVPYPDFCPITYTCHNEAFPCTWTSSESGREGYGIFDPIELTYKSQTSSLK